MLPKFFLGPPIYVGTMSFHFRNIFQWESFHRHRQRHRHQSPTHFLKIDWKLEINFLIVFFFRHPSSLLWRHDILGGMFKHSGKNQGHNTCTYWSSSWLSANTLYLLGFHHIISLPWAPLRRCSASLAPGTLRLRHHPRGLAPSPSLAVDLGQMYSFAPRKKRL